MRILNTLFHGLSASVKNSDFVPLIKSCVQAFKDEGINVHRMQVPMNKMSGLRHPKYSVIIILTTFSNINYASFPVNEKEIVLISEDVEAPIYTEEKKIWGNLSFYLSILSLLILPNPGSSLLLSISAIIFGIIGLTRKVNWKEITGLIIGLISALIGISLIMLVISGGGLGAAFGG